MQRRDKLVSINLRHIEPIKIREMRISSRKTKRSIATREKTSSSEYGNSTAVSQKSMSKMGSSVSSAKFENENCSQNSIAINQDPFLGIQEINETSEYEEDSVILELNQLLTTKVKTKERSSADRAPKPPLVNLKIKLKEKIKPIATSRKLSRAVSHRVL